MYDLYLMSLQTFEPLTQGTASKLHDICAGICERHGLSIKVDSESEVLSVEDDVLRHIVNLLINGMPDQVAEALPDDYSVRIASVDGFEIGVLDLGNPDLDIPDSWYMRVATTDEIFYVGLFGGAVVLAQEYKDTPVELTDVRAMELESKLEGK